MSMPNLPFLATKLQPPRRVRGVIARPRLEALLVGDGSRLLTLIKAPAGSGKTTLALSWSDALVAGGACVAWLSIDSDDDEPERFFVYLAAALDRARAGGGRVDRELERAPVRSLEAMIATIVAGLEDEAKEVFLFLDDYHLITSEEIHARIGTLLERAPENFHLIILGRLEPPIWLAAYRARGQVLEIDGSALRFEVDETAQLVRHGGYEELPAEDVSVLNSITEGWVAGLRAVMLSLREHAEPGRFLRRLSGLSRPISGLFADLLDQLPQELSDFILQVSVVDRVSGTLAEALTGRSDGHAMLVRIEKQQLFLGILDPDGLWFAFHPLFREYLQRRLQVRLGADVSMLHRRAATWHATRELWSDAIRHALAAGDAKLALGWIDQCAMRLVARGDIFTLMSWERQLHTYVLQSPCRLRLALAWGLALGIALDDAERLLGGVEGELAGQTGADARLMQLECQALRAAMIALRDDCDRAGRLAGECLDRGVQDGWVRNVLMTVVAAGYLDRRDWDAMCETAPEQRGAGEADRYLIMSVYGKGIRAAAEFAQGRLANAEAIFEEALRDSELRSEGSVLLNALLAAQLGTVLYEQNRLQEAFTLLPEHRQAVSSIGSVNGFIGSYRVALAQARDEGQSKRLQALFDEVEHLCGARRWSRAEAGILVERVRFALEEGRLAEACGCARRLEVLGETAAEQGGFVGVEVARYLALVRGWVGIREGRYEAAIADLEPQLAIARKNGNVVEEVRAGTALALARHGAGDLDGARSAFDAVCRLAARSGAIRPILDQPMPLNDLVALVRADGASELAPILQQLTPAAASSSDTASPDANLLGTLSPRETHILQLLAEGKSNKEIARALGIAPETVKSHLKKVYSKLDVGNRAQAAARAQSLVLDGAH